MGWGNLSDFAAGMNNAVQQQLMRRMEQAKFKEMQRSNMERERQNRDELEQRRQQQAESIAGLREQREANSELRRQNAAHSLGGDLSIGDELDSTQAGTLRAGNMGSNVRHDTATLPSTQYGGAAAMPGAGDASFPTTKAGGGFLTTRSNAGNAERDVYRGTPGQRKSQQQTEGLQRLIQRLPAGSRERQALEYQLSTGENAPAAMWPKEPTTPTPRYSMHQTYDESGMPGAAVRFNSLDGSATPIDLPGGSSIRGGKRPGADDPALPRGVQNYLMQLQSKYPSHGEAMAELQRAIPSIQEAHPSFSAVKAASALRGIYGQPSGSDSYGGYGPNVGGGPSILGGDAPMQAGAAGGRAAAGPAKPKASAYTAGQSVRLKDGSVVRVKSVNPDGSIEIE